MRSANAGRAIQLWRGKEQVFICGIHPKAKHHLTRGDDMSLGKAMIHARKQKSAVKAVALVAEHSCAQHSIHATHILQMPVLVLNASYEPINICGARRALVLVLKGIARTEEEHGLTLHAQRAHVPMPSVIRLLEYRRIPYQTRALSRKNILLRDRNTCQYCGEAKLPGELTLDHVVPRSRGGNSTWENLVACCHSCNRRKGNRLIHEIDDMALLREPRAFSLHTSRQIMRMLGRGDDRWRKYLFY
jgi:5-methylcytosine-specific restriction endonuclease McrA